MLPVFEKHFIRDAWQGPKYTSGIAASRFYRFETILGLFLKTDSVIYALCIFAIF